MESVSSGKKRRANGIRFISSAEATSGDALVASANLLRLTSEQHRRQEEDLVGIPPPSLSLRGPDEISQLPSTAPSGAFLFEVPTASLLQSSPPNATGVAARPEASATVSCQRLLGTEGAAAAMQATAGSADSVASPDRCVAVTSGEEIDFSAFTQRKHARAGSPSQDPSPLQSGQSFRKPAYTSRQQQRQQRRNRRGLGNAGRKQRGYGRATGSSANLHVSAAACQNGSASGASDSSYGSSLTTPVTPCVRPLGPSKGSFQKSSSFYRDRGERPTSTSAAGGGGGGARGARGKAGGLGSPLPPPAEPGAGLLPITALLFAAAEKEATAGTSTMMKAAASSLSGTGQLAGEAAAAPAEAAVTEDAEKDARSALLRWQLASGSAATGDTLSYLHPQQQRAQDSYYVRKHMQNVAQAKNSQKQMREFEQVLRTMEEEAVKVRRKARQRMPTMGAAGGMGGAALGQDAVTPASGFAEGLHDSNEAGQTTLASGGGTDAFHGSPNHNDDAEDDGDEDHDDDDDDFDDSDDGGGGSHDGVGLMYIGDEGSKRYTPLLRRQQQQQQRLQSGGGGGGAGLGKSLSTTQQRHLLRRQLVAAERFLREHPELEATLRKELIASESRLSAARTVRAAATASAQVTMSAATGTAAALAALEDRPTTGHLIDSAHYPSTVERLDWSGYSPTGIGRHHDLDASGNEQVMGETNPGEVDGALVLSSLAAGEHAPDALCEYGDDLDDDIDSHDGDEPLPLHASSKPGKHRKHSATAGSSALAFSAPPSPPATVSTRDDAGHPFAASLSDSLRNLSYEDQLAELLERGNGRSVYGTEGTRSPMRAVRRRSARLAQLALLRDRQASSGGAVPPTASATPSNRSSSLFASTSDAVSRRASSVSSATAPLSARPSADMKPSISLGADSRATSAATAATAAAAAAAGGGDDHDGRVTSSTEVSPTTAAASRKPDRHVTFAAPKPATASTAETASHVGAGYPRGASLTAQDPFGAATASAMSAAGTKRANPPKRSGQRRKPREPLPVVVGVGDRAAAELQKELMQTRLEEMEAQMTASKDTRRTCELLGRLQPLRESLLHRDVIDLYGVSDPRQWESKYPRRSAAPSGAVALPQLSHNSGGRGSGGGTATRKVSPSTNAQLPGLQERDDVEGGVAERHEPQDRRMFANVNEVLERHHKQIFNKAFELDDEQRKRSRLMFIDVLEKMSERQIPAATWPAAQAALNHARDILLNEPRDHQSFIGFQAIVHKHFSLLQLIQWPVQQMLEHLSALFLLSSREYKEWLANLYQKLSSSHDYEARFRAIDRTIKAKEIPDEAQVRIVLHACRRLPRTFLLGPQRSSQPVGAGRVSSGSIRSGLEASAIAAAVGSGGGTGATSNSVAVPPSNAPSSMAASATSHARGSTALSPLGSPATSPLAFTVPHGHTTSASDPCPSAFALSSSSSGFARQLAPVAALSTEPMYSIRIEAERQAITSSAVAAIGTRNDGAGTSSSPGEKAREGAPKTSGAGAVPGKNVNFFNQTFKLHLYDASSLIRVTLLRDGQPIAVGSFSVQRYGNGKKIQLWLPLTLTAAAANGSGGRGTARGGSKRTEIKMTVELM